MRLHGKGLPRFGGAGRGDLYVNIAVRIPEQVDDAERRLWERLRLKQPARGHDR
jgi:DnaJ-class molecular chaperone